METQVKKLVWYLILPLALLTVIVCLALPWARPDFLLHINFYDVGQGSSVLVQTYLGRQVLINGGGTDTVLSDLGQDLPFYDHSLDLVIVTNPDASHLLGLIDVLKRYKIEKILLPSLAGNSAAYTEFMNLIASQRIEKIYAYEGQRIWLDEGTVFDVLWPPVSAGSQDASGTIVGRLIFGKNKILLAGNADAKAEQQLTAQFDLHADVLQIEAVDLTSGVVSTFVQAVNAKYVVNGQTGPLRFVSDGTTLDKK